MESALDLSTQKFNGRKVLVTGHTGFKGSWLITWLKLLGANVVGIALDPPSEPSHFESANLKNEIDHHHMDIRDLETVSGLVRNIQPDFVFHLAAQSLVQESYKEPVKTFQTNVMGTLNILEGLRNLDKACSVVLITSDKAYQNQEWDWGYRETDQLGGSDPYSGSKGAAEVLIKSYIHSFFPSDNPIRIGIARAGNVIGGGDWAADRIVPDCIRSWSAGESVVVRDPDATRPWQHVLEPLSGYIMLASQLGDVEGLHGEPFNFGPLSHETFTVHELVSEIAKVWGSGSMTFGSNSESVGSESKLLKLNCDKALRALRWRPTLNFAETVQFTAYWYRERYEGRVPVREITQTQLEKYMVLSEERQTFLI